MITKEQFEELIDEKLIEKDGKLVYDGNLMLYGRKDIKELPDNLKVLGFLILNNSGITKLPKGLEVEYWINISGTNIEELPEDTKFGLSLYINEMKKPFSFPKVLKVNGRFECRFTTIKRMPEELHVKEECVFSHSKFDKLPKVMEVINTLNLYETPTTELSEGLKEVYGYLTIYGTNISKLNDNLVIYSDLFLGRTPIKELSKGLIIGRILDLSNTNLNDYSNLHKVCSRFIIDKEKYEEIKDKLAKHSKKETCFNNEISVTFEPNYKGAYLFENENGKYINADYIFSKIVEQKGNVYHIQLGKDEGITYLITDGEGRWAHGRTLETAKADLLYKTTNRDESDYENLSLDSELSFEDAIVCYRVVTGACSFGTRDFIEHRLGENKKAKYTIKEIISLTEGEYGNEDFREFFCKD